MKYKLAIKVKILELKFFMNITTLQKIDIWINLLNV